MNISFGEQQPPSNFMQDEIVPTPDWVQDLNSAQRQAVENVDGPCLVLAGAGTGKTRVLTARIAQILYLQRAHPYQILCVTFTNKAAAEMRDRLYNITGKLSGIWLGTFHNLCLRIVRKHADLVGLGENFIILDDSDQVRLIKDILMDLNVDKDKYPAKNMISYIQRWKDKALTPQMITADMVGMLANGRLDKVYTAYQNRLQQLNAVDFGDLILHALHIFESHPDILAEYQQRFQYLLVDEYQDTNTAQYKWLRLLSKRTDENGNVQTNICCVGDDDQSIYSWRGADVKNILRFETDFANAQIIRLEQNYRSRGHILKTANALIGNNDHRHGKNLFTKAGDGNKVKIVGAYDGTAEAVQVSQQIEQAVDNGESYQNMAILVRTNSLTRVFESRFVEIGIPYKVVGGAKFYEREEIRDVIAYLRLVHQSQDNLAFDRIINKPARGIGKNTVQTLHALARVKQTSLYECATQIVCTDELPNRAKHALKNILDMFEKWRNIAQDKNIDSPHIQALDTILEDSGYLAFWQASKDPKAPTRVENIQELYTDMKSFQNLGGYLEHIALHMDSDEIHTDDMVSIMTLHTSKGLEFNRVFLVGWEDGLFPSNRSMDDSGSAGLEEERRLAYVGITRAQESLQISYAHSRIVHGKWTDCTPSRFLDELPPDHIDVKFKGQSNGYNDTQYEYGSYDQISIVPPPNSGQRFSVGDRCFHQKFGMGTVASVDGDYLTIGFDHAGTKKVMATFVDTV